ncbi:hypothetical protein OUZ56_033630 [Daphnia magna]|uniref:Uncharacterized protein n=1 Tax=Daphnia magna TaxID=35525 RepID=A0ABQ9ZY36_9CRUS|nr:hypothetical protein OUZ56_033630 [Daphnia magna]
MAAAVNHMPSLLQSRTAFHSTVNVGCVPVRGDCSLQPPKQPTIPCFFTALLTTIQQSSQTAPFLPPVTQPRISMDRWLLAAFPFAVPKQPPTHVSHSSTVYGPTSFKD